MGTTKRTTANYARNIVGEKIRLLKTRLTADSGLNTLTYDEVRNAVKNSDSSVMTTVHYPSMDDFRTRTFGYVADAFGAFRVRHIEDQFDPKETYFNIGCHIFTLKMFNRILRAAGVRTTKSQILKTFKARA
jgi:hypothetical protein